MKGLMKTPQVGVKHHPNTFRISVTNKLSSSWLFQILMQRFLQKIVKQKSSEREKENEMQQRSMQDVDITLTL